MAIQSPPPQLDFWVTEVLEQRQSGFREGILGAGKGAIIRPSGVPPSSERGKLICLQNRTRGGQRAEALSRLLQQSKAGSGRAGDTELKWLTWHLKSLTMPLHTHILSHPLPFQS